MSDYVRAQTWHLFNKANNASGVTQAALKKYKETHRDNINCEVIEWLATADAFGQDVFKDAIRQIQFVEPVFTETIIDQWLEEGRIAENHKRHFIPLILTEEKIAKRKFPWLF